MVFFLYLLRYIKAIVLVLASVLAVANGWTINCQYTIQSWGHPTLSNAYTCFGEFIDDGGADITSVTGNLDPGKTLADVLYFSLSNANGYPTRIYKIPSNFGATFPSLRGISWMGTKLETIKASNLQAFPDLVTLIIGYNFLRHIDGDLLKYNPKLIQLDLSDNFIDFIGPGIFNGLTKLQYVMIYGNRCIDGMSGIGPIDQGYTVADFQADLEHLCGPLNHPGSSVSDGACSANCIARFDAIEAEISTIETRLTAPWYEKLKWFFTTAFGL